MVQEGKRGENGSDLEYYVNISKGTYLRVEERERAKENGPF